MSSYDDKTKSGRTSGGFSGAKDSGEVRRRNQYIPGSQNPPIKEEDESGEDSIQEETFPQQRQTRETVQADKQNTIERQHYEQQRRTGRAANGVNEDRTDEARELDEAWRELKFFIGNRDPDGLPAEIYEDDKSTPRYKLSQALDLADATKTNRIPFRDVFIAFQKINLETKTGINKNMLRRLLIALECFSNVEQDIVSCSDILQSTYKREDLSMYGVFPSIKAKEPIKKTNVTESKSKIQNEEEKLMKRKKEMEDAKAARI
jgi:hypothetical protein